MAVLRIQENIKKADGTYDAVYKETEAGLVLFDDNETLQQKYDAGELNGQDIYAEAVAKGYTGTEDEFFTMLASGPWVSRSGDPGLSGGSLKFLDGAYGISIGEVAGYPTLTLVNDNGGIAGSPLVIANVESPQSPTDAANKKYVDDAVSPLSGLNVKIGLGAEANYYGISVGPSAKSGSYSTALGGMAHAPGEHSVAIGYEAIIGCYPSCIAIGHMANCAGSYSVALGKDAKAEGTSIAIGLAAAGCYANSISIGNTSTTSGDIAIAIGCYAQAGYNSIAIGQFASANDNSSAIAIGCYASCNGGNCVALGAEAKTSRSDWGTIQLGYDGLSALRCHVSLSVTSDIRDKTDITPISDGAVKLLEKITPISYCRNQRTSYIDTDNLSEVDAENRRKFGLCEYDREAHAAGEKKGSRRRVGVSAQAVQEALAEVYGSANYANIVNDNLYDVDQAEIPEGVESQLTVNYEGFIPFLIKAVQELSARVKELEENQN